MSLLDGLLAELDGESRSLDVLVADLNRPGWQRLTPATPWTIADTIGHLVWTDRVSLVSCTAPGEFARRAAALAADVDGGSGDPVGDAARAVAATFDRSTDLLAAWRDGRAALADALRGVPEDTRLPWFGTAMKPTSMATARLMETWAHGHDVAHALAVSRPPTHRLRHVARLAVRARPYAYAVHDRVLPSAAVRVELDAPDGGTWRFGPDDAVDVVTGSAYDFCLLAVRRLHRDDTDLVAVGEAADDWLGIVQAFAGPPGTGRRPGEGHR